MAATNATPDLRIIVGRAIEYRATGVRGIVRSFDDERGYFVFPDGGDHLDGGWWTPSEFMRDFRVL